MPDSSQLVIGADPAAQPIAQAMRLANRHGLIAGATGTGKTVTLQRLAEAFSDAGVAVFAADIKGDLCGLGAAGNPQGKVVELRQHMSSAIKDRKGGLWFLGQRSLFRFQAGVWDTFIKRWSRISPGWDRRYC